MLLNYACAQGRPWRTWAFNPSRPPPDLAASMGDLAVVAEQPGPSEDGTSERWPLSSYVRSDQAF